MIRIFKTYEGSKELREITEIERESWVMKTDPNGAELQMVAEKYQIDLDDLRRLWMRKNVLVWNMKIIIR